MQALNLMAVLNPRIRHVAIDGGPVPGRGRGARKIMAVPTIFLNGQPFGSGRMEIGEILLARIDTGAAARDAAKLAQKDVRRAHRRRRPGGRGGGAVYAARKGIRTGIVAERFGGQTLDTLGIENFISVLETEGPKFAAALEAHARHYDVDIMNGQRARSSSRRCSRAASSTITLANGAQLRGKTLILPPARAGATSTCPAKPSTATRAWPTARTATARCSRAKVAVIGGGNSGVEAAIDLPASSSTSR